MLVGCVFSSCCLCKHTTCMHTAMQVVVSAAQAVPDPVEAAYQVDAVALNLAA